MEQLSKIGLPPVTFSAHKMANKTRVQRTCMLTIRCHTFRLALFHRLGIHAGIPTCMLSDRNLDIPVSARLPWQAQQDIALQKKTNKEALFDGLSGTISDGNYVDKLFALIYVLY